MVGQIQALITADKSQFSRTTSQARREGEDFKRGVSKDPAKIDGDSRGFERAADRSIRSAGIMRTKVGGFIGELRGELLAVGAVAGIVGGFRAVVMAASDLAESANAIEQTFGNAAGTVLDFTATASRTIGQSNVEARDAAATFGVYGKQAGLATEENAAFSISMTRLASDLASFRNTSPQEAIEALGAALRGESDPIEKYGVLLTEAVLQQRALKMGVIATTSEALTPQQRVMVAYQEILAQTEDAQGDFARTQGGLANQLRELRARVIDGAAALGKDLLPSAQSIVTFFNGAVGPAFEVVGTVLKTMLGVIGDLAGVWSNLPGPVQAAVAALLAWRLMQDRVTEGASGLGERITQPWRTFSDEVRLHTALAAAAGQENISKLSAAMSVLQSHDSVLGNMAASYRNVSAASVEWMNNQHALTVGSNAFTGTLRGMVPAVSGFASTVAGATAAVGTGLRGAMSSLVNFMGGGWGLAIAAGTLLIGQWIGANQQAKARQEELAAAGKRVAEVIREQNGEINKSTRAAAAKAAEDAGILKIADQVGISMSTVTSAILDQDGAYKSLQDTIKQKLAATREELAVMEANNSQDSERLKQLAGEEDAYIALAEQLAALVGGKNADVEASKRVAEATGLTVEEVQALASGTAAAEESMTPLQEAVKLLGDESASAEEKVSALKNALDALAGKHHTVEEANQAVNDSMRGMVDAFDEAQDAAAKSGTALIDASGAINTTTEAGSALQDNLMGLADAYRQQYTATLESAQAQGKTLPQAAALAQEAAQGTRQRFLEAADAAGVAEADAIALANQYGLMPEVTSTQVLQPGMTEGQQAMVLLGQYIYAVPGSKNVHVSSNAAPIIRLVEQLGFTVVQLPNGDFEIIAQTGDAQGAVDNFIRNNSGRAINLRVTTSNRRSADGGWFGGATGGVAEYYAEGGLRPLAANGSIVGSWRRTGVQRVIGDNPRFDEAFIPLNRFSARSQDILDETIRRMRPELWTAIQGGMLPMAAGGILGGDGESATTAGGGYVDRSIHLHEVQGVPTIQQLQDLQHEQEVLYGIA